MEKYSDFSKLLDSRNCHGSVVLCVSDTEAMSILDEEVLTVKLAVHLWEYHLTNDLMFLRLFLKQLNNFQMAAPGWRILIFLEKTLPFF